jgi:hypothetical protein
MLNVLSYKEEYQGEMFWESTQILRAMFVKENNLKIKIWEVYIEDRLV